MNVYLSLIINDFLFLKKKFYKLKFFFFKKKKLINLFKL